MSVFVDAIFRVVRILLSILRVGSQNASSSKNPVIRCGHLHDVSIVWFCARIVAKSARFMTRSVEECMDVAIQDGKET